MSSSKDIQNAIRRASCEAPEAMRQRLWKDITTRRHSRPATDPSGGWSTRSRTVMRSPAIRIALAALLGTGIVTAATVGVRYKYRFLRTDESGHQLVEREDGLRTRGFSQQTAASPEQAVQTAEELDLLEQQDRRELVTVSEWEVNGQLDQRWLTYEYYLSDGRTVRSGGRDPHDNAPGTLTGERLQEAVHLTKQTVTSTGPIAQFRMTDKGIVELPPKGTPIPTYERVIQGRTFIFEKYTFTLSDGTPVAHSHGMLKRSQ